MKFSELKPMLGWTKESGHQLTMVCPWCKQRFGIAVSLDGKATPPATFGLKLPADSYSWDEATVVPSINKHPTPRGVVRSCHFSITKGAVKA